MTEQPIRSALYEGTVQHRRLKPKRHLLAYRVFWLNVDIDELPVLDKRLRLFSFGRFNLFSLHAGDYGPRDGTGLRAHVERSLREAGLQDAAHRIELFTMPRILGYAFNPLSVYFCQRSDGRLGAMLYEVSNTFGQRHSYLIPVEEAGGAQVTQTAAKTFYVSPFIDMAMRYVFRVKPPSGRVAVSIIVRDEISPLLSASLHGKRRALTDAALLRVFFTMPFLTMKVVASIHWEALKLWLKGVTLVDRPAPPDHAVTALVRSSAGTKFNDIQHVQPRRG